MKAPLLSTRHATMLALALLLGAILALMPAAKSYALSGSDFNPGLIIDDGIFTNKSAMSVSQIQAFLNNRMPSCDVNGTGVSPYWAPDYDGNGVVTKAEYGQYRGNPAPFTCLKDYRENTTTGASNYGGAPNPSGSKSAAQIIWDAAQAYDINPQVILVKLQKEQALITDDWPFKVQYDFAMGYGCFDNAGGCSETSEYPGFFEQVDAAAWQLRQYMENPQNYNFAPGSNFILYNPNTGCGGSNINIFNHATAALYNYTPYQPNQAALDNLYGTGNGCSAYGNRNFWRYFNDWFGSSTRFNGNIELSSSLTLDTDTVRKGQTVTATVEIENTSTITTNAGSIGICARLNGSNYDFGLINDFIVQGESKRILTMSRTIGLTGTLNLFVCSWNPGLGGWASDTYPYINSSEISRSITKTVLDNPLITTGLSVTPSNPVVGQPVTASFVITNSSPNPINIGSMVVAGRDSAGNNYDFGIVNDVIVPANGSYTYTSSRSFNKTGTFRFYIANWKGVWSTTVPKSESSGVVRSINTDIKSNPLITTGITLNPVNPKVGQPVTASFVITNSSPNPINIGSMVVAARENSGANRDFPIVNDVIVPGNGTYTYSQTRTFNSPISHSLFIANWKGVWSTALPDSASSSVVRQTSVTVLDNPLITTGLSVTPSNPVVGQPVTASFVITNSSPNPINIGSMVVAGRDSAGNNYDFGIVNDVIVPANGSYTYTSSRSFNKTGTFRFYIANWKGVWSTTVPKSESNSIIRELSFKIN